MNQEFKNYLAVSWDQVLSDEKEIINLLTKLNIPCIKNIVTVSREYTNDNRLIMLLEANNVNAKTFRFIIDATSGIPTWQQFINVTYDHGNPSDIKIILYGEDYGDHSFDLPAGGLYDISNLVRHINKCGGKTYLVKGIDYNATGQKILRPCVVEEKPEDVDVDANMKFPSKLDVQKAEFWTGYYLPQWCAEPDGSDDDIINDWEPGYSLSFDLSTKAFWNDEGFFIDLRGEAGSAAIRWIWANQKHLFQEAYPDCSIELRSSDNEPYAISVKIVDIPIGKLIQVGPRDKWEYGELVYNEEHKFVSVAEEAISDYKKETKASDVLAAVNS